MSKGWLIFGLIKHVKFKSKRLSLLLPWKKMLVIFDIIDKYLLFFPSKLIFIIFVWVIITKRAEEYSGNDFNYFTCYYRMMFDQTIFNLEIDSPKGEGVRSSMKLQWDYSVRFKWHPLLHLFLYILYISRCL